MKRFLILTVAILGMDMSIFSQNKKMVEISGVVVDDNKKPLKAQITVYDCKCHEIKKMESSPKNGAYKFSLEVPESTYNNRYVINFFNDSSLFEDRAIYFDSLGQGNKINYDTITLYKLEKMTKLYQVKNIDLCSVNNVRRMSCFVQNSLYRLLEKNPKMKMRVEICEWANGWPAHSIKSGSDVDAVELQDYLIAHGINKNRLYCVGTGDQEVPKLKHNRIEITVKIRILSL